MDCESNIAAVASLMADPTRAVMLVALLDGRALPAGELAYAAGVTAQTASTHLAKLLDGGVLEVEREGRHRYYRLAGAPIAEVLEQLAAIGRPCEVRRRPLNANASALQFARCCYNHLAGALGVSLAQGLMKKGLITPGTDKRILVTETGVAGFAAIGLDVTALRPTRLGIARQCLDWTERRHHLAGPLGIELLNILCVNGWLRRSKSSRAVSLTAAGRYELRRRFDVDTSQHGAVQTSR
ncbi:transcriptional regulator [Acidihalobacter yilgarnensis]|uniref:Transcriptional regulator n=1 Tax=Acidihalobacter yilgarnensis TaxID=2819280 RepID=A0A1D8IMQ9_9GAMM|nr:helix-turn-helix transcriptional regulator [Acidihalobacter yilgarnensis]AOU97701.1 transcriptional regulator [Acidihalobacter yilgarnensis]